jgi:hypothetical protein
MSDTDTVKKPGGNLPSKSPSPPQDFASKLRSVFYTVDDFLTALPKHAGSNAAVYERLIRWNKGETQLQYQDIYDYIQTHRPTLVIWYGEKQIKQVEHELRQDLAKKIGLSIITPRDV